MDKFSLPAGTHEQFSLFKRWHDHAASCQGKTCQFMLCTRANKTCQGKTCQFMLCTRANKTCQGKTCQGKLGRVYGALLINLLINTFLLFFQCCLSGRTNYNLNSTAWRRSNSRMGRTMSVPYSDYRYFKACFILYNK